MTIKQLDSSRMNPARLNGAVDVSFMASQHIVCIGIGGASGLCENLVRSGLGKLTAVDFDTVDAVNLCTQGFYTDDIGLPKVDALGKRLKNINPDLEYHAVQANFLTMSDSEIEALIAGADLLMMMTDDFHAQAKGNKVALHHQIPALFAIMYEKARCAEITFSIPGVTPGCHRCAVSSRYDAYKEGYVNNVTATGSTIFHTYYLNSCLGFISLAILHRNVQDTEFSNWFGNNWDRNLIQLRMHPEYGKTYNSLFERTFRDKPLVVSFDSVWQKVEPEAPPKYAACPDCGGTGDLQKKN